MIKIITIMINIILFFYSYIYAQTINNSEKFVLTCNDINIRTKILLENHFLVNSINDEVLKKIFDIFFDKFDNDKIFFLENDINHIYKHKKFYYNQIINNKCDILFDIKNIYIKKIVERIEYLQLIKNKTIEILDTDKFLLDTNYFNFAINNNILNDRIINKIKYHYLKLAFENNNIKISDILNKQIIIMQKLLNKKILENNEVLLSNFINAIAQSLDPYSAHFLPSEQEELNFKLNKNNSLLGIYLSEDDGVFYIDNILQNSYASTINNLSIGDKLISVDLNDEYGIKDINDYDLQSLNKIMRGLKSRFISIQIEHNNQIIQHDFDFNKLETNYAIKNTNQNIQQFIKEINDKKIGIIRLPTFYADYNCDNPNILHCNGSSGDVFKILEKFKNDNINGLVLDLRNNGGGDVFEALKIIRLFINNDNIAFKIENKKVKKILVDNIPFSCYNFPLIILINKYTASAAELVALSLQDYKRAIIVGDKNTYGKGTMQIIQEFSKNANKIKMGALKITYAKYYSILGHSPQLKGVSSDIKIPSYTNNLKIGEIDKYNPLNNDQIESNISINYSHNNMILDLKNKSLNRIANTNEFKILLQNNKILELENNKELYTKELKLLFEQKYKKRKNEYYQKNEYLKNIIPLDDLQISEAINIMNDLLNINI